MAFIIGNNKNYAFVYLVFFPTKQIFSFPNDLYLQKEHKKREAKPASFFSETSKMILSDHKFLFSHAFVGVDLDEIIESGILHELPECLDYGGVGGGAVK